MIARLLLVVAAILTTACGPECLVSHQEIRTMPAMSHLVKFGGFPGEIWTGEGVPILVTDPPYDYEIVVCDRYRAEKDQ